MLNYNKIYLLISTIIGLNLFFDFLPKTIIFPLGILLILISSYAAGSKNKPDADFIQKLSFGFLDILIITSIIGAAFFYLFSLGKIAIIIILIALFFKTKGAKIPFFIPKFSVKKNVLEIIYFLTVSLLVIFAAKAASDGLIKSPWINLPSFFLPLFFAGTLLLIFILEKKQKGGALSAAYFFLFFSIAALVYKLGYGFDQFVHEASQKYILEHGTITPKTLQYIGLYSINIFINQVAGISIEALNKFLLPLCTAIIFPIAQYSLQKSKKIKNPLAILALLLLPFSYFIVTTPQAAANLLLLILIIAGRELKGWALPIAILLIHPITGIIALIYQAITKFPFKKITAAAGIFAIPVAFIFLSYKYSGQLSLNYNIIASIKDYARLLTFGGFAKNYNLFLDLTYLIQFFILPTLVIISIWTAIKFRKELNLYPLYLFGIATASFFLTRIFADFSYLIRYEQQNYPERIFYVSLLFLAPYLIFAADRSVSFLEKQESPAIKLFFAGIFAFSLTANFYLTYPCFDNYKNDKGKNLTSDMLYAAEAVKKDSAGKNYVVLTDQAVSAAALKSDGFKKYYSTPLGEVFYYPIPTGGPLYNEFLNLIYNNAGAKSAENAIALTGAEKAYVILPSYWENYKKIKENLLLLMKPVMENENITVLKY
ncbi:MAG: hypothetical protein WC459_04530 [Patescibacteria group bacterium]